MDPGGEGSKLYRESECSALGLGSVSLGLTSFGPGIQEEPWTLGSASACLSPCETREGQLAPALAGSWSGFRRSA